MADTPHGEREPQLAAPAVRKRSRRGLALGCVGLLVVAGAAAYGTWRVWSNLAQWRSEAEPSQSARSAQMGGVSQEPLHASPAGPQGEPWASALPARGVGGIVATKQRATERARRWAILIGVSTYEDDQGIGSLKYCVADVRLIYEVLTGPLGGFARQNVLVMTDDAATAMHRPTYSNLVTMIPRWLEDVGPEDDVLIAFSGHGLEEGGECYLLPRDAKRGNLRLTSLSCPQIREWLESCRAKRKVLILDACHSGAGKAVAAMGGDMRREIQTGRGFLRLASCDTHQKSNEDNALGHGVFTHFLVTALRGKGDLDGDGRVGAAETYRYVARGVSRWAREHGLRQDPLMSGRVVGGMFTLCYAAKRTPMPSDAGIARRTAQLYLTLEPAHSEFQIDGKPVKLRNDGTVALVRVLPGRHVLDAAKSGYARLEKVIDVPSAGAEGVVRLAPQGSGEASYAEVEPKATTTVAGAITAGLISPLPGGALEEQVRTFRQRWEASADTAERAAELYPKGSPELHRLALQRRALGLQAAELMGRVEAEARKAESFIRTLVDQGRPANCLVVRAAGEEVRQLQAMTPELLFCAPKLTRAKLIERIKRERRATQALVQDILAHGRPQNGAEVRTARAMAWCKESEFSAILFGLPDGQREEFRERAVPRGPALWIERNALLPHEKVSLYFLASPELAASAWVGLIPSEVEHGSTSLNDQHDVSYQYLSKRTSGIMVFKAPGTKGAYDFRLNGPSKEAASVSFTVGTAPGL